jgi:hypothetical protein
MPRKQPAPPVHGSRITQHASLIDLLTIAVAVAWLLLVGAGYAALFLFPAPPDYMTSAPTPPDLSRAYLPLLATILILGIIRRLPVVRRQESAADDEDA